jgi:energy-coupling factor transporter ATP-binding protein EcfA2
MRIEVIGLSWFRGAADPVALELDCKSVVVYGENGSGKSSFVDAIEYVLRDGKIGHLSHEYSGKHQERGIINTHTPEGRKIEFRIGFKDGSELKTEIKRNGSFACAGGETAAMSTWEYQRTVLRQDELANFIRETKGDKYSALLPLLGLHQMEIAAENLRQLAKSVEQQSKLKEMKASLAEISNRRRATFGSATGDQIINKIEDLHTKYCETTAATGDPLSLCKEVEAALNIRINSFTAEQKRHLVLQDISGSELKEHVKAVRAAGLKLAGEVEPLISEKLEVLESAGTFSDRLGDEEQITCPACGRRVSAEDFKTHVKIEKERLQGTIDTFDSLKEARGTLCDTIKTLRLNLRKTDLKPWRDDMAKKTLAANFIYADGLNAEAFRASCGEEELKAIEDNLLPIIRAASLAAKKGPTDVSKLSADKEIIGTCKALAEGKKLSKEVKSAEALISFLNDVERAVRDIIRIRSQQVIQEISEDIRGMWSILHPGEEIEDVRLYLPKQTDKAIDIGLKFFGVEQDSPRLTLSEGHRNSLGLCIFLAMAKREADKDRPLILDDVVVSFDRSHRGMIVELLEKEFAGRQIIIMTHEREWYAELRQQLDGASWNFKALRPYERPDIGIRWSEKAFSFDDARAFLKSAPDSAGNTARKIMDIELSFHAEQMKIRLPYLHRERNDHRMAHDFLSQLISDGEKCFKRMENGKAVPYIEAVKAFREADILLVSWGNKASHSFDLDSKEAAKLIAACEKALEFFICPKCKKAIHKLDDASAELVQCQCGDLQWRYGKA